MWLRQADNAFRFPIFPSYFEVKGSAVINTTNIIKLGEVVVFGGIGLRSTDISSFFPNQNYPFCNYTEFPKPYDCVALLKDWMEKGLILRYIVTETNINFECIITDFSYKEQDGTRDVYFTLNLKEYKRIQIPKVNTTSASTDLSSTKDVPLTKGFEVKNKQKTHKVVKGDNLWSLAKKYYGNGDLYEKIVEANKKLIKTADHIEDGWVLVIP